MASSISSRLWHALPPLLTTTAIAATVTAAAAAATATRSALASASASLAAARTRGGAALTRSAAAVAGASVVAVRGVVPPLSAATAAAAVTPTAVAAVRAGGAPATGWAAVAAAAVGEAAAAAVGGAAATATIVAVLGVAGRGRVDGTRRGAGVGRAEAGVLLSRLRDRLAGGGPGGGAWLVTTAVGVAAEVLGAGPLAPGGGGLGGPVTAVDLTDLVAAVGVGVAASLHAAGGWDVLLAEPPVVARGVEGEPVGAAAGMPGALEDHPLVDDPPWGGSSGTAAAAAAADGVAAAAGASTAAVAALAAEAADVLDLTLPLGGSPAGGLPTAAATLAAAARVDRLHPGLADGGALPLARALPALARAGPALLARLASAEGRGGVLGGDGPLGALLDGPDLRRVFAAAFLSGERWPGDGG